LIDEIVAEEFASPDLELHWLEEDEGEPEKVLEGRLKVGAVTLNEMRDALGLDPFDNAAADRPMVLTATGFVPIEANAGAEGAKVNTGANAQSAAVVQKYNPDQPRVPQGNPHGGEWTKEDDGGSETSGISGANSPSVLLSTPTQIVSDANPDSAKAGEQYAQLEVKRFDRTQNLVIDGTSIKLSAILARVMGGNPPTAGMTPQQYGTFIHLQFADAVRSARLPGIGYGDVETTFPEGNSYGSPDSIRTDVVLRNVEGKIIAIYDVKTGESGLTPARADQLRAKTRAPSDTPVIEIRLEGILLKIQVAQSGVGDKMRGHYEVKR
jgi:hypothetical protein